MKKAYLLIILVLIAIVMVLSKYNEYKAKYSEIKEFNIQYEEYINREISGTEITSVINKAVDNNEKNNVKKDEQNRYIQNDYNSVIVEVKITDLEEATIIPMETFYNGGMTNFVSLYNTIKFKNTKVEYNKSGKVSYLLFEQIDTEEVINVK